MSRRAVIYARISVTRDDSVSIARQIESAEQYCASRGWKVVGTFVDDGVSASDNRPEKRPGWRSLLDTTEQYDAVIIWKVDRLARKVLDFLHADEALQNRGAGIVAVEQSIDMTTGEGRAFAQMLAVFGEMEAAAIAARVAAGRQFAIRSGRAVGGKVPYGWRNVANPNGPGKVVVQDPDQIEWVRQMVKRAQRGDSLYSITKWLDSEGVPTPTGGQGWLSNSLERILRHPILAGATSYNPGNVRTKTRGTGLLSGPDGLPVVNAELAVMSLADWRALVAALDNRDTPQAKPRALKAKTSGLLSGLVWCGDARHAEPVRMWRGTTQGRPGYSCPECSHTITNFEDALVDEFLRQKGDWVRWSEVRTVTESGHDDLPEIDHQLDEIGEQMRTANREQRATLQERQNALLDLREHRLSQPTTTVDVVNRADDLFGKLWSRAEDVEDRRAVLEDAIERVVVMRGRPGRRKAGEELERLHIKWKRPFELGPRPQEG